MRTFLRNWLPPVAWMGLIFLLSAQPQLPSVTQNWLDSLIKKGGHMLGYAILASLYLRALQSHGDPAPKRQWLGWGLAVLYAVSDEFHQRFVPGRNGTPVDIGIDAVGAGLAMLFLRYLHSRRERARRAAAAR